MTCLSILRLVPEPGGRIVGGGITFDGEDLLTKSREEMRQLRGSRIAMLLQDPMASLNPAMTVGAQIAETLTLHRGLRGRALDDRVLELLRQVRISDPERRVHAYPHQMSGGIRPRGAVPPPHAPKEGGHPPALGRPHRHPLRAEPAHRRRADDLARRDDLGPV